MLQKLPIKLIISLCISIFISTISSSTYAADDTYKSVFKIKSYVLDSISGNYSFSHYWSAVLVDKNHIVTNAHVILDEDGYSPTGYYEVCKSENSKQVPTCFSTAKLVSYDIIADLAILELPMDMKWINPIALSDAKDVPTASTVVVYGYPAIGGYTITRTEGKIWGIDGNKYKFDGTIDHGNSGGWAFDTNGKLIGIPYAVKSDNGMIGYIIPTSTLKKFLLQKTNNYQNYTEETQKNFITYINNLQSLYKNKNLLKTKYVEIKNAGKMGFVLKNSLASNSGEIFVYQFTDIDKRVLVSVGCSRDSSTTWKDPIQFIEQKLSSSSTQDPNDAPTFSGFLDANKQKFALEYRDTKKTKGDKSAVYYFFDKSAPNCAAVIYATDGYWKDKNLYEKWIKLIKTINFTNSVPVKASFTSNFFNLKQIPANVIVSENSSIISATDISPDISILFSEGNVATSSFKILKFDNLDWYMNYDYSDEYAYKGKDYSFDAFFNRYKTTNSSYIEDIDIRTKDGKRVIITFKNYDDLEATPAVYEQEVVVFYPFKTTTGEYMAYSISFTLHLKDDTGKTLIKNIISNMEFPGTSPFKN